MEQIIEEGKGRLVRRSPEEAKPLLRRGPRSRPPEEEDREESHLESSRARERERESAMISFPT